MGFPGSFIVETQTLQFTNESEKTVTYAMTYTQKPKITVTISGSEGSNINLFLGRITKTVADISGSTNFSGTANIHIIGM